MEIIITERYHLKWEDYLEYIKIVHNICKDKGEKRVWISSGVYCLWCLYWIFVLKNTWYILIPVLILDMFQISIYIFCISKLYRQQKLANKLIDKQQKILLNFKEKELSVFYCGTGDECVYSYEEIVSIELKNVFLNNLPVFIKKESLGDKTFTDKISKNISSRSV